jgi:phage tail protein X
MLYIVQRENETLDEIVYTAYGSSFGYLELVLNANTFLYNQDIYLTQGLIIDLPDVRKDSQTRVSLWS